MVNETSAGPKGGEEGKGIAESFSSSVDALRRQAEVLAADARTAADQALAQVSATLVSGGQVAADAVREGLEVTGKYVDEGKVYAGHGLSQLKTVEDAAFAQIKSGLDLVHENPYLSYPLLVTGSLLLLPGTRRLLYRATLGRLRSTDNIIIGSEGKVEGIRVKLADYSNEAKKLQDRMLAAEEEYLRGRSKLKATRQELTRLAAVVSKSQRAAANVLEDLRTVKKVDKAVELRAEAASQVSALKAQRSALQQYILRIASKDI